MDRDFDDTIHTLYSPDSILWDYYYPFKYRCIVKYCSGKLQLVNPVKWVEEDKITGRKRSVRIAPSSIGFKKKQVVTALADLLNSDFNNTIQNVQRRIADYRAVVDSGNVPQEELMKAAEDLLSQFVAEIGGLNLFFNRSAPDLLRDELIVDFYNRYNKDIAETDSDYAVTAEHLNGCVNGIMKFIDPLLTVVWFRQDSDIDAQSGKEFFKDKIRRFLLNKILSCRRVNKILLASPVEDISDSLSFLAQSCEFLHEYRDELSPFTSDEKLEICVRLFSVNSIEENYHSFRKKWGGIHISYSKDISDAFDYIRVRMKSDKSADFHSFLSSSLDFSKPASQEFVMENFSSVVFLALLEMIRNGDASHDSNTIRKNTYIIKCQNCKCFFIPTRSNVTYCNRKAPGYDKTCVQIGAKRKSRQNRTDAKKEYEKIRNRISTRISNSIPDDKKTRNNVRTKNLQTKLLQWEARVRNYTEQLNAGTISEDEYIKLINDAEKDVFFPKR